jgi:hypothetical protein
VPTNQRDRLAARLREVEDLRGVEGCRCAGPHAEQWERGDMIWDSVKDVLSLVRGG